MENPTQNIYTISTTSSSNNRRIQFFNNLATVTSRSAMFKKRTFLKKLLIASNIIIIILLIAFVVILCNYVEKSNELKKLRKNSICTSEECLRSATNLKLSMDLTVDPCEDFYKFTCGRWTKEHLNHGWYPHYSSFEIADERIAVSAITFFESNISLEEPLPARQSKDFYLSCMDSKTLDGLGVSVMVKYLKRVNLPVIPSYFNDKDVNFKFDWIKAEVDLKKTFAMDTFIGFTISPDLYNKSNDNVIHMSAPDTKSPLPSALKSHSLKFLEEEDDFETVKINSFKNVVKDVIKIFAQNQTTNVPTDELLEDAASVIWNITRDVVILSEISVKSSSLDSLKITVDDLQNVTNQYLIENNESAVVIWRQYLTLLFEDVQNVTLDLDKQDLLYSREEDLVYLLNIALYLSKVTDLQKELYMWWTAVNAMMGSSTTEIKNIVTREEKPFVLIDVQKPKSIECATVVIQFMGLAVSYGIADQNFRNDTEPKVQQMLNNIKEAFVERVATLNWMDDETKRLTLEKSREMISFIGFPEWLMDKDALETYYSGIHIEKNEFLNNMMTIIQKATPRQLESLREKPERDWVTDPTTINAFNYFPDNSITVPMAILTFPFYNLGLEVLNYGAIGSILGHEVTHGFDTRGRLFDKYGNYKEWWTNNTRKAFEDKTSCFINQYSNFSLPNIDENVDGNQTLAENLADNGGLNHAFLAYQHYLKIHGPEPNLPGFENFSNLQMFFVAFSSVWCETSSIPILTYQIATDEHSPHPIRVLGTLQNSEQFSKVFQCPRGSKMNPNRNACRIW